MVLRLVDLAAIRLKRTADALHQGGLAGAIMTSEGNALGVTDGKGEVFEDDTGSKFNAEVFDSKHGGGVGESREEEN